MVETPCEMLGHRILCHLRQQGDHVRTCNTVPTSREFVGSSKVPRCDAVQIHCDGYVAQHLVGVDFLHPHRLTLVLFWNESFPSLLLDVQLEAS